MTAPEIQAVRDREDRDHCTNAEQGRISATLENGIRWEALGLGRVFFVEGVATWHAERHPKTEAVR